MTEIPREIKSVIEKVSAQHNQAPDFADKLTKYFENLVRENIQDGHLQRLIEAVRINGEVKS